MLLSPFRLERFFAQHEFRAPHLLCASDGETLSVADILDLIPGAERKFGRLRLGYTDSHGSPALRATIATLYETISPDDVLVHAQLVAGDTDTAIESFLFADGQGLLEPGPGRVEVTGFLTGQPQIVARHVYGGPISRRLVALYVWLFRGIPILVQLYLFYFGILAYLSEQPALSFLPLSSGFFAAVLVLGLTSAAYQSQIFRGAILGLPAGQLKAARALGMDYPWPRGGSRRHTPFWPAWP